MKEGYIKRYKTELKFSERQLEQMSAQHLMDMFMENNKLRNLSNINPEWIEQWKYKNFPIWCEDELKRDGVWDVGRIKIRKTKKGFVLELKFKWTSKGIKKTQYLCRRCKKAEFLNFELICKKCTNYLKKKNKFRKFWETNPPILKCQKK